MAHICGRRLCHIIAVMVKVQVGVCACFISGTAFACQDKRVVADENDGLLWCGAAGHR